MRPLRSLRDAARALGDHLWTAWDVGRRAHWQRPPRLVDLLAGGRRQGFCESSDALYSVGFVNLRAGCVYRLTLGRSPAFYTAVSLHSGRRQVAAEFAARPGGAGQEPRQIMLCEGGHDGERLATRGFRGLTQIMVRQYYRPAAAASPPPLPVLERLEPPAEQPLPHPPLPAFLAAGLRFAAWRLQALLAFKLLMLWQGRHLPRNRFLTMDDLAHLRHGARETVPRMGLTSFAYAFCAFDLGPGQCLRIRYRPAGEGYFTFSLNNAWLQGLGRGADACSVSSGELEPLADGSYLLEVGERPRGGLPHLATRGYRFGVIHFRRIFPAPGEPRPVCTLLGADHRDRSICEIPAIIPRRLSP